MKHSSDRSGGHSRTKRTAMMGGVIVSLALLAGCVTASDGGDDNSSSSFSVAMNDPISLTPGNTWAWYLESSLFTAPLSLDPDTGRPVPGSAESVESDDQQNWTVTIKEGWTFHNGEAVTAQSFVDGWNATALGKNAWLQNFNFAGIEGYDALNPESGEPTATELSGLEVISDTVFTVKLKKPYGLFPYALTRYAFAPLPSVAFEDPEGFDVAPIGNGPYMMANTYEPDQPVVIKKFADYKGNEGISAEIEFVPYQSLDTAYNDMLAGNLDVVYPVPPDRLGDVSERNDDRIAVSKIPNLNYLGYPTWDDRFKDVRVRKALSMAIDREALTSTILKGSGAPAYSIGPDTTFGAVENTCEACEYDPTGAKKLLEEAGGWDGPLVLWGDQYGVNDQVVQAIGNQLRTNLGIEEVTFEIQPQAQFSESLSAQQTTGPYLAYQGTSFPHLAEFLQPLVGVGGYANYAGYSNDEVNSLLEQGDSLSIEEGIELYKDAEAMIWDDMPLMPLYYGLYTAAWSDNLVSVPVGVNGLGDLTTVELTK